MAYTDGAMIAELRNLLDGRPELIQELRTTRSLDDAAEALSRIAAVNGLPMGAAELRHYFRVITAQRPGPVSDADLDHVTGGGADMGSTVLDLLRWRPPT